MSYKASKLVENLLREFDMAVGAVSSPMTNDPYKNVDPKLLKTQQLIRILQDNAYKMIDSQRVDSFSSENNLTPDIKELITTTSEPVIKVIVKKLYCTWFGEQTETAVVTPPVVEKEIEINAVVISPQQESFIIKKIVGDEVILEDIKGNSKLVSKQILKVWMK